MLPLNLIQIKKKKTFYDIRQFLEHGMSHTPNSCAVLTHLLSLFTAWMDVNACSAEACISSDNEYGCKITPDVSSSSTFCWVDFSSWLSEHGSDVVWNNKYQVLYDGTLDKIGDICCATLPGRKASKTQRGPAASIFTVKEGSLENGENRFV